MCYGLGLRYLIDYTDNRAMACRWSCASTYAGLADWAVVLAGNGYLMALVGHFSHGVESPTAALTASLCFYLNLSDKDGHLSGSENHHYSLGSLYIRHTENHLPR